MYMWIAVACMYVMIIIYNKLVLVKMDDCDIEGEDDTAAGKYIRTYVTTMVVNKTKQKHLGCKKEQGQSEATLQTGRHDQKV